jgi:hypothetical protein
MPDYEVPIVRSELLALWHEYNDAETPTERSKLAAADGSLGQSRTVRAASALNAAIQAEQENPGYAAVTLSIRRMR